MTQYLFSQENIKFKNLTLLIIDEEQHFGVAQKEKLKKFLNDKYPGVEVVDHGTDSLQSVDYPDIAKRMCRSERQQ